ncbi:Transcriptional regulator containing PAS, AAA-type ATPase, and DNA-binding Fis domains [Thermosyntropha lipolytica DSM 11003]|uniref:Transcriptional regulator containing PAS, AAA-type ATPase, and DNA-binding Fis domains n=1 Tax=Thermosyntropha lipolytica DSM 11003 TaxID=1123382 RepID=A0A1M5N882_9FIRM|nr:sigma 54-interacting transcriptional regulator [Thermosyntropha lipolytica]SHG85826.1 Transcriptional regulator containing PAS, AAA-type ATPase, and DNA-binding Fis domains [Thermosyntropha lipolytica DSM 11003]
MKLSKLPPEYFKIIETIFNEFDGALIIDEKGIIRVFTDNYARETGLKKEEVVGKRVDEVFPHTRMLEVLEKGVPIIADIWEYNGKSQVVSRIPITANGQIIGAAGFSIFRYHEEVLKFAHKIAAVFSSLETGKKEKPPSGSMAKYSLASIVGRSEAILEAKEKVRMVASSSIPVCIYGETGTGKELFAHALHFESSRREYPLIRVNCAAIPEALLESELFGYEEGAFTGASKKGKIGKFELAHRGSIFLDEVSELSPLSQAKLLRVLQEKEFERVGGVDTVHVDVRVISATNVDLKKLVEEGKFRQDLLFRLEVFPIYIPPLRERLGDIELLCEHFIDMYNRETGNQIEGIEEEVLKLFYHYSWPGNVRELEAVVKRACVKRKNGLIKVQDIVWSREDRSDLKRRLRVEENLNLKMTKREAEKEAIRKALAWAGGNKTKAAALLGLSRSTLYYKINKYGLEERID